MSNFSVIYKILKMLEAAMDYDEFDKELLSAERFGISENRLNALLVMLEKNGYVTGVSEVNALGMKTVKVNNIKITLKGLEYLEENSIMKRAMNMAKGIKDSIPMI